MLIKQAEQRIYRRINVEPLEILILHGVGHGNTLIPCYNHVYDVRNDKIGGGCSLYNDTIPFRHRKDLLSQKMRIFQKCLNIESNSLRKIFIN